MVIRNIILRGRNKWEQRKMCQVFMQSGKKSYSCFFFIPFAFCSTHTWQILSVLHSGFEINADSVCPHGPSDMQL